MGKKKTRRDSSSSSSTSSSSDEESVKGPERLPPLNKALRLNSGWKVPLLGLGTWMSKPGEVAAAVKHALKVGYRHFDAAAVYGNEKEVGEGLRAGMKEYGIKRESIFVTSKLWNNKHHFEDVEPTCRQTLADLGLEYLDLYLIHWPIAYKKGEDKFPAKADGSREFDFVVTPAITWHAMEKLVEKKLVRSIGVSNFNSKQIMDLIDKKMTIPAVNQVECHAYLNQDKMLALCKRYGIIITAYSPLGSPSRPVNKPNANDKGLLGEPKVLALAKKYNRTPAQILLRYQLNRKVVVIPKSVTPARIEENAKLFDFKLSDEDMKALASLNKGSNGRCIYVDSDKLHPQYPFHLDF